MAWEDGGDISLTAEERMVRDTARSFAREKVAPLAEKIDKEHYFPRELVPEMGKLGFLGATISAEHGGAGLSEVAFSLMIEELAAECATTSIILSAHHSLCARPVADLGDEKLRAKYLPGLISGELLGCFALSEPGCGSDAAALRCGVKEEDGEFIVNGSKAWITNGPEAALCLLFATEDASKGHAGISAFVHEMALPGVHIGKREEKLGIRGSATAGITYENVRVGAENMVGRRGNGFAVAMEVLCGGRIGVASQAIGIARASIADSLAYVQERKTFGKFLHRHATVRDYLAEMIVMVDSARHLAHFAARKKEGGLDYVREASMAKYLASKAAVFCADKCVQLHGGYGYVADYAAERHYRDAKITEIYEGTTEIQRMVIARSLLKEAGVSDA